MVAYVSTKILVRSEGVAAPLGETLVLHCFVEAKGYNVPSDAGGKPTISFSKSCSTHFDSFLCTQALTGAKRWH